PQRGRAIEDMIQSSGDAALRAFADTHLAQSYREGFAPGELMAYLARIRDAARGFDGVLADAVEGGGVRLIFVLEGRETSLVYRVQGEAPHFIVAFDLEGTRESAGAEKDTGPPYTWDALAVRLDQAEASGFSGAVLVVHGGKIVLDRGYGLADRENSIPVDTTTIFSIGSVPIDFTKAAILKLEETGKLNTSDTIMRFFKDVPDDKRAVTIDNLMTGTSGLPNFHDIAGVDTDPDLSWIDRATAIDRILHQDLLFAPGRGEEHSHSAWVMLAAIVEIASGETYGDYLRRNFFEPAGMTRTGLHEDAARFPDRDFAVGYEGNSFGRINTPRYWGKTSWLVMGSGGMFSTPHDLHRWLTAIRSGKTLSAAAAAKYWTHSVVVGGDDRGFFCLYTVGPEDLVIMCSNAHSRPDDLPSAVGMQLVRLVMGGAPKRDG
ncbi:MAG: beta-lactamase family protein, partial [Candidatus Krumholzibacteria bacterium]|nr:beta-lactamase family protein [Candidatus Krumholzibacteria bacterium]